jgi:hypothetical protein
MVRGFKPSSKLKSVVYCVVTLLHYYIVTTVENVALATADMCHLMWGSVNTYALSLSYHARP